MKCTTSKLDSRFYGAHFSAPISSRNKVSVLLLFLLLLHNFSYSQHPSYVQFTSKDGLPSSEVYDIVQDDYGFIWFSTDKGISRFNGYEFENFDELDGLPQHVVFDFLKLPNGEIWCTTLSGELFTITGFHPKFTKYKYNHVILKHYTAAAGPINSLLVQSDGTVYISFKSHISYLAIDPNGKVVSLTELPVDLDKNLFLSVFCNDDSEPYFFKTEERKKSKRISHSNNPYRRETNGFGKIGICEALYFDAKKMGVFLYDACFVLKTTNSLIEVANLPRLIASGKLSKSLFWTGHKNGGVRIFNMEGQLVNHFLPQETVTQIMLDDQNNYWISTADHGVFLINNFALRQLNLGEHTNERIHSLESDGENLFIGTYYGTIFKKTKYGQAQKFGSHRLSMPVSIYHCKENSETYFTSDFGIDSKDDITESRNFFLSYSNGKIVASLDFSTLSINDLKKNTQKRYRLPHRSSAVCILNNRVFLGTHKGIYELKNEGFEKVKSFGDFRVNHLAKFKNEIVVCTNGNGLFILSEQLKINHHFTTKTGLSSNFISNVHIENGEELWCSSNVGIDKISFAKNPKVSSVDLQNFLPSYEISDLIIFKNSLYIATKAGLFYVSLTDLAQQSKRINYHLNLKSFLVKGVENLQKQSKVLSYDQNEIEFLFTANSFVNLPQLLYRYKLVGADRNWRTTHLRSVNYAALAPGKYTFIVQVRGSNHSWELNQKKVSFEISSPFWKTWWFIILTLIAIFALIYVFFKFRILSYNRHIIQEILRHLLKRIRRKVLFVTIKHQGKEVKIESSKIHFIKSEGNYLEIHTSDRVYVHRASFDQFIKDLPDAIEYLRVHRSYVVRIDNIEGKSKKQLVLLNQEIPVGRKYWGVLSSL